MLPVSRGVYRWTMSMVTFPARKEDDHAAADPAGDTGPGRPGRAGTPLPHHPRRRDPYPLPDGAAVRPGPDRKSTRLNSSHVSISYAVFCLKKKKKPYYLSLFLKKKKKQEH